MDEKELKDIIRKFWEHFKKVHGKEPGDALKVDVYREPLFTSNTLRARATLRRGVVGAFNAKVFRGSSIIQPDGDVIKVESPRANLSDEDWLSLGDSVIKALYAIEEQRSRGENPQHVLRSKWDVEEALRQSQTRT